MTAASGLASASVYQFYDGVGDPPPGYPSGGTGVNIFVGQWGAQSFTASTTYVLAEVDLWAANKGSSGNASIAEIRPDSMGSPDMAGAALATGTAFASGSYGWVSFTLAPQPTLAQGTTYWLVLENNSTKSSNGWTWWNTQNDTAIIPGDGALATGKGGTWNSAGGDFELRALGYQETSFALGFAANLGYVGPGDTVLLTLWMNNSGTEPARAVWVNVTLPAGMTYVSDNSSAVGGTRIGPTNWSLQGLPAGSRWFRITAKSDSSTAGLLLTIEASLAYTDFQGLPRPAASASVTLTTLADVLGPRNPAFSSELALPLLAALGIAGALGAVVTLLGRRRREAVKEVFLVHASGLLLVHFSRTVRKEKDRDLLVGMLTAIQAFIRESFSRNPTQALRKLDFGDCEIVLAKGAHSYLAVLVEGHIHLGFTGRMRGSLAKVEATYRDGLADWDGGVEAFDGADTLLMEELLGGGTRRFVSQVVATLSRWVGRTPGGAHPDPAPEIDRTIELLGMDPKATARELLERPELGQIRPGLRSLIATSLDEIAEGRFSLPSLGNIYMGIAMQKGPSPATEAWWDLLLRTVRAVLGSWTWDSMAQAWVSRTPIVPTGLNSTASHVVGEVHAVPQHTR